MPNVIVSVKLKGQIKEYDLEVPADVPAQKLAELITHNLDPNAATKGALMMRCIKPGAARVLAPGETLAQAGLWDGVFLEIGPTNAILPETWADILLVWEPLELDSPPPKPGPKPVVPDLAKPKPPPPTPPSEQREQASSPPLVEFESLLSDEELRRLGLAGNSGPTGKAEDESDRPSPARRE